MIDVVGKLSSIETEIIAATKELKKIHVIVKPVEPVKSTRIQSTDVLQRMADFEERSRIRWEKRYRELVQMRTSQLEKLLVAIQTNQSISAIQDCVVRTRFDDYVKVISNELYALQTSGIHSKLYEQSSRQQLPRHRSPGNSLGDICGVGISKFSNTQRLHREFSRSQNQNQRQTQRRDAPLRLPQLGFS